MFGDLTLELDKGARWIELPFAAGGTFVLCFGTRIEIVDTLFNQLTDLRWIELMHAHILNLRSLNKYKITKHSMNPLTG